MISAEHAINRSETRREALSLESLGTKHCRHYISLHYIHQALPLTRCSEGKNPSTQLLCRREKTDLLSSSAALCSVLPDTFFHIQT